MAKREYNMKPLVWWGTGCEGNSLSSNVFASYFQICFPFLQKCCAQFIGSGVHCMRFLSTKQSAMCTTDCPLHRPPPFDPTRPIHTLLSVHTEHQCECRVSCAFCALFLLIRTALVCMQDDWIQFQQHFSINTNTTDLRQPTSNSVENNYLVSFFVVGHCSITSFPNWILCNTHERRICNWCSVFFCWPRQKNFCCTSVKRAFYAKCEFGSDEMPNYNAVVHKSLFHTVQLRSFILPHFYSQNFNQNIDFGLSPLSFICTGSQLASKRGVIAKCRIVLPHEQTYLISTYFVTVDYDCDRCGWLEIYINILIFALSECYSSTNEINACASNHWQSAFPLPQDINF